MRDAFGVLEVCSSEGLLIQVEVDAGAGAGLAIADFHFLQLPDAIDLFDLFGIELFQELVVQVKGVSVNNDDIFGAVDGDPAEHARVAAGDRMRINALQNIAELAFAHLLAQHALLWPMQEFQPQISHPKVGAGKRDHEFPGREFLGTRAAGLGKEVLIRLSVGMNDRQLSALRVGTRGSIVDIQPLVWHGHDLKQCGDIPLLPISIADLEHTGIRSGSLGLLFQQARHQAKGLSFALGRLQSWRGRQLRFGLGQAAKGIQKQDKSKPKSPKGSKMTKPRRPRS